MEFVKITNMLKLENGEDPYFDRKVERLRIRNKKFEPLLKDLSSFLRDSYRIEGKRGREQQRYVELSRSRLSQESSTLCEIYGQLNRIISSRGSSSIISSLNCSQEISFDNFTSKQNKYFVKKNNFLEKTLRIGKEGKILKEKDAEQKSVFLKKMESSRGRGKKVKRNLKKSKEELSIRGKKNSYLSTMMKRKRKNGNSKNSSRHEKKFYSKGKSSNKLLKKSQERLKKSQDRLKKSHDSNSKRVKFGKFDWNKLNKKFSNLKEKRQKRKQTESIDFSKKSINRHISAKQLKSSVTQSARHKRERSLEKFREELKNLKKGLSSKKSNPQTARTKRGHYKNKSDFSLGVTYFTKLENPKYSDHINSSHNYLKLRRKSGGQLDLDYLSQRTKTMTKKSIEKKSKNYRKIQFENIYKNRFSSLKNELKIFKSQRKSKPITFTAHFSGTSNMHSKRQKKYLAKQNKLRVGSMTNMKLMKMAKKAQASLIESKILNKIGSKKIQGKNGKVGKRGKHKYTRSEPGRLLGLKFLKKIEREQEEFEDRRESRPFNTHRGQKRGQSIGHQKMIYSSRNR